MRTPLLAGLIAVLLPACVNEITGVGEEDMGSGSGSGSGSNNNGTPGVAATIDKSTVTTQLAKTETITVNLTSEAGFSGDITIVSSLLDNVGAVLPNVTLIGPTSVTLAANGTASAPFVITVPMNATGTVLSGTLKVSLASDVGTEDLTSAVTVNNIYTVDYALGTGITQPMHMNPKDTPNLSVKRGAIIRFHNSDDIGHIIHGNTPFPHEDQDTAVNGLPGRDYDLATTAIAPGTSATVGCHTHGTDTYASYTVE